MASVTSALTGGLIDPSTPNYGNIAKRNERQRQQLIQLGLQQINSVFGGGTAPFYSVAAADPFTRREWREGGKNQVFYSLTGKGFRPYYAPRLGGGPSAEEGAMTGAKYGSVVPGLGTLVGATTGGIVGGFRSGDYTGAALSALSGGAYPLAKGLFGDDPPSPRELVNKRLKRGLLFNAPNYETFEGFQPDFYAKRAQDYANFALPQVAEQYRDTRNAMLFGLANRGLSASSVGRTASANLERTAGTARQTVADTAIGQANQLRRDVERSRQEAIGQLYQSADPAQAFQSAIGSAASFRQPSTFAPIANLFSNLANQYYLSQVFNNYRQNPYASSYGLNLAPV